MLNHSFFEVNFVGVTKKKTVPLQYQTKSGKIWKHFQANDKVGFSSICWSDFFSW